MSIRNIAVIGLGNMGSAIATLLLKAGYRVTYPMYVYFFDFSSKGYRAAQERASSNNEVTLRPLNKKNWQSDLGIFREVINENFTNEWLWYPAAQHEFADFFECLFGFVSIY
jgi:3-hydroxyacyl-CoA dehydrogenase